MPATRTYSGLPNFNRIGYSYSDLTVSNLSAVRHLGLYRKWISAISRPRLWMFFFVWNERDDDDDDDRYSDDDDTLRYTLCWRLRIQLGNQSPISPSLPVEFPLVWIMPLLLAYYFYLRIYLLQGAPKTMVPIFWATLYVRFCFVNPFYTDLWWWWWRQLLKQIIHTDRPLSANNLIKLSRLYR